MGSILVDQARIDQFAIDDRSMLLRHCIERHAPERLDLADEELRALGGDAVRKAVLHQQHRFALVCRGMDVSCRNRLLNRSSMALFYNTMPIKPTRSPGSSIRTAGSPRRWRSSMQRHHRTRASGRQQARQPRCWGSCASFVACALVSVCL